MGAVPVADRSTIDRSTIALVVPSTSYRVGPFLAAARALAVEVVVITDRPLVMVGDAIAGSLSSGAVDQVLEGLAGRNIDAVIAADGAGQELAAALAERLGLAHNPIDAIRVAMDKAATREALTQAGLAQPDFELVAPGARFSGSWWPAVFKPTDRSGGQGVQRADDDLEATTALGRLRRIVGADRPVLVESFVAGPEVAIEGLLTEGELTILAVFDKPDQVDGPTFPETILVTPSRLDVDVLGRVTDAAGAACAAVGLIEGPVHIEARLGTSDQAVILEINPRSIGGLCSRTMRFGAADSLEELLVAHALGHRPEQDRADEATGVLMLPVDRSGTLVSIDGGGEARAVEGIEDVVITASAGERVEALPEGGDAYLGFVFARAAGPDAVEHALRFAWSRLTIAIGP